MAKMMLTPTQYTSTGGNGLKAWLDSPKKKKGGKIRLLKTPIYTT